MNYYEHHIRDYDAATAHLTWDEDLAYARLLRWYYRKEQPIPADIKEACRQVRASSKVQRDAVASVLREFFELREDGWHNATCDEVIAAFLAGEPEREVKKANEENRLKRHRDERARLFKILTDAGEHAPWNIKMEELRELVKRVSDAKPATHVTKPATAPATPATATQTPVPNPQDVNLMGEQPPSQPEPVLGDEPPKVAAGVVVDSLIPDPPTTEGHWLTWFNREAGMQLDPSSRYDRRDLWPLFKRWCDSGITQQQMRDAIRDAQETAREPIACLPKYVDRVLANKQSPPRTSPAEQSKLAAARAVFGTEIEGDQHGPSGRIIDVTPVVAKLPGR